MSVGSLQRLVEAARALPGEKLNHPRGWPVRMDGTPDGLPSSESSGSIGCDDLTVLRARVAELLTELSVRVEPVLYEALQRASSAWDQVDAVTVIDAGLANTIASLRRDAEALRRSTDEARAASGLEILLTVGAAGDLVALIERRLATLVRIRMRDGERDLLPDGRPFLDLAAALDEAARGWT